MNHVEQELLHVIYAHPQITTRELRQKVADVATSDVEHLLDGLQSLGLITQSGNGYQVSARTATSIAKESARRSFFVALLVCLAVLAGLTGKMIYEDPGSLRANVSSPSTFAP